jgi:hypothetical protein
VLSLEVPSPLLVVPMLLVTIGEEVLVLLASEKFLEESSLIDTGWPGCGPVRSVGSVVAMRIQTMLSCVDLATYGAKCCDLCISFRIVVTLFWIRFDLVLVEVFPIGIYFLHVVISMVSTFFLP